MDDLPADSSGVDDAQIWVSRGTLERLFDCLLGALPHSTSSLFAISNVTFFQCFGAIVQLFPRERCRILAKHRHQSGKPWPRKQ